MKVLILGGTTEASALAKRLAGDSRFAPTLSLAGRTAAPAKAPIPTRIGGFGGAVGLARYLREEAIDALIDATHPFAAQISANAAAAAKEASVALMAIRRPAWKAQPGDSWIEVADMAGAAEALGQAPRRILLTVGRLEAAAFAAAPQHSYLLRSIDPPGPLPLPDCQVILARGPFDLESESRLLSDNRIEILVTKNAGSDATAAKLIAARNLGLPVVMVARPPLPEVESVETVIAAMEWLSRAHATAP